MSRVRYQWRCNQTQSKDVTIFGVLKIRFLLEGALTRGGDVATGALSDHDIVLTPKRRTRLPCASYIAISN